jgi:N-methylhydantoinase A/oxoprolinase/acetone carboxylase beta subunit
MSLRIGVDVGGTHTDAVLLDGDEVRASTKCRTTADIGEGVVEALSVVTADLPHRGDVRAVMIGTTQFTNAVVERRRLAEAAIVRIALPSGRDVPPQLDWPDDLADALGRHVFMVPGGRLYDGRVLAPPDEAAMARVIDEIERRGLGAVAIASVFAPVDPAPELEFAERLAARLPHVRVVCSHVLGRVGILERENAALLNAALLAFADEVVDGFDGALSRLGLDCPLYISQNDGTLMATDFARRFPALTFASGPTNSLRGASLLAGRRDAVVIDIGGTTSDVGVLRDGFPRESNLGVAVGGARTNFRMPDILALGIGGGSRVAADGSSVGPTSVGYRLVEDGRVFGGDVLTATDVAVADQGLAIGDPALVAGLDRAAVERAVSHIHEQLDIAVDRMRTSRDPVPVILVGGGAILVSRPLPSASELITPDHAGVANAIGAAHAEVGVERERIAPRRDRERVLTALESELEAEVIRAGARADSVRIADLEESSVAYMAEDTVRIRMKTVGALALEDPS